MRKIYRNRRLPAAAWFCQQKAMLMAASLLFYAMPQTLHPAHLVFSFQTPGTLQGAEGSRERNTLVAGVLADGELREF